VLDTDVVLVCSGPNRSGTYFETVYKVFRPETVVVATVFRELKKEGQVFTVLEWSCRGLRHEQVRFAEFDETHLKRVCLTCFRDGETFDNKQKNLVNYRKGYENVSDQIRKHMEISAGKPMG
jgi:hypothetical protein